MKLTDITEKKSTYWRTSEKKPKLSKPSKKHQQRHPGQSRGMVGDSVEFDDKPVDEMYDNPEGIVDTMNKSKKNYLKLQLFIKYARIEGITIDELSKPEMIDRIIARMRQDGIDLLEVKKGDNKYDSVAGYIWRSSHCTQSWPIIASTGHPGHSTPVHHLCHHLPHPAVTAPVAELSVAHVDQVHLVVLSSHHVTHCSTHRLPSLHASQSTISNGDTDQLSSGSNSILVRIVREVSSSNAGHVSTMSTGHAHYLQQVSILPDVDTHTHLVKQETELLL